MTCGSGYIRGEIQELEEAEGMSYKDYLGFPLMLISK